MTSHLRMYNTMTHKGLAYFGPDSNKLDSFNFEILTNHNCHSCKQLSVNCYILSIGCNNHNVKYGSFF